MTKRATYERECSILTMFKGTEGIISLLDSFEDDVNYYMVFEFHTGKELLGHLMDLKEGMKEETAKILFFSLLTAVEKLHTKEVFHNDLKSENVMVDFETHQATLIDFGFAEISRDGQTIAYCGSEPYMCPNKLKKYRGYPGPYEFDGEKSEVWSLGTILYTMLVGAFPWSMDQRTQFLRSSHHPKLHVSKKAKISPEAKDLLCKMLEVDDEKRLSIPQILQHPWLENFAGDKVSNAGKVF